MIHHSRRSPIVLACGLGLLAFIQCGGVTTGKSASDGDGGAPGEDVDAGPNSAPTPQGKKGSSSQPGDRPQAMACEGARSGSQAGARKPCLAFDSRASAR